jgi:DNA repair exonuclease SbcCD ATPase subunit
MTTDTDRKIKQGFERLILGRPEITDGALTISNICTEAGVSRASYYRSPHAAEIKQLLDAPQTKRPEIEDLRDEIRQFKRTERRLRSEHAAEIREVRDTLKTYANQIQALVLRAAQLEDDNQRLQQRLERTGDNITPLNDRR